jgi:uncharacterized protein (PEP-CTERM system associated)
VRDRHRPARAPAPPIRARAWLVAAGASLAAVGAAGATAQTWQFEPGLDALFTLTDNVNLSTTDRKADFVTELRPALKLHERGAHTRLDGTISMPVLLYARTGGENNEVLPQVDLAGTAELVERLFFLEASANVSQQYISPFGARPADLSSATNNRYTAQSYRVSPVVKGRASGGYDYELRDDNIWSDESNTSIIGQRGYTNDLSARLDREPRPLGFGLDYERTETRFTGQFPLRDQRVRGRGTYRQSATLEWFATGGYEENNFEGPTQSNGIYGGGIRWHPTERTVLDASAEHRFFGTSYHVTFDHRTPLSVWSLRASRDVTSYPQQLAALGAGDQVSTMLDRLFTTRVPDPTQRQTFVDQLIRERGLPTVLTGPLALFSQQVTLLESLQANAGLIGARNSIVGTIFRERSQPIGATDDPFVSAVLGIRDTTQTGGNVVWTWKVTPLYTLTTSAEYTRSVENVEDGQRARQFGLHTSLFAKMSPRTDLVVGARWQRLLSNIGNDYREAATFVGIHHLFR